MIAAKEAEVWSANRTEELIKEEIIKKREVLFAELTDSVRLNRRYFYISFEHKETRKVIVKELKSLGYRVTASYPLCFLGSNKYSNRVEW